jgi:hypothetical protein
MFAIFRGKNAGFLKLMLGFESLFSSIVFGEAIFKIIISVPDWTNFRFLGDFFPTAISSKFLQASRNRD